MPGESVPFSLPRKAPREEAETWNACDDSLNAAGTGEPVPAWGNLHANRARINAVTLPMNKGLDARGEKLGVLVVEDNADDEVLTLRALKRCGVPLIVTVARDGAEAMQILQGDLATLGLDRAPRLMLLDLKLPRLNGLEVLEAVRADSRTASLPVVCLTSSDEERDTVQAYGLGANSYVRKPIDFEDYIQAVSKTAEYWLTVNFWPA